jgi:hypothetical protein
VRRGCYRRCPDPVADRSIADTERFRNGFHSEPCFVRSKSEANTLLTGLSEEPFGPLHGAEKIVGFRLVLYRLRRTADPVDRGRSTHGCAPRFSSSVGTTLARRMGTWNDPTRVSLGQGTPGVSLRSMVSDLAVAHSAVNGDRCLPCSRAIVLSTLRSPTVRPVECSQCCHFSTYTRRNRQVPVNDQPTPSRRACAQLGARPDRRTASLYPTRTPADAETDRGEH